MTTTLAQRINGPAYWRKYFNSLMPEYRCAQRMHATAPVQRCQLKWSVVYYGRTHLEGQLARCIDHLGGMGAAW